MSRVYFHSPSGTAEIRGSERAYAGLLTTRLACAVFDIAIRDYGDSQPLKSVLPRGHYLQNEDASRFRRNFETWLQVAHGEDACFHLSEDRHVPTWDVVLNTSSAIGNDPLKFLARMHAQCEIHGYVEGENRGWLAGIIEQGRELRMYRGDAGWESAIELLKARSDEPVVMSYSVCEQFPGVHVGGWMSNAPDGETDAHADAWYELPHEEKWRISLAGLRGKDGNLRIQPDDWETYGYGEELSAFDVIEQVQK